MGMPTSWIMAMQEEDFPLDVLGAQTEGMIGYMIEQELGIFYPSNNLSQVSLLWLKYTKRSGISESE
jgi:carbamate kinase